MRSVGKKKQLFPLARSEGLLIEDVDSEKVVFDEQSKQAHCLTPLASIVFGLCDGQTSPVDLARVASERLCESVGEGDVQNALAQLDERGLLASPLPLRISRREMVHKSAAFGAAAAAATLIFTVEPPMAQAANCSSIACSSSAHCSSSGGSCPSFFACTRCGTSNHLCECRSVFGPETPSTGGSVGTGSTGSSSTGTPSAGGSSSSLP